MFPTIWLGGWIFVPFVGLLLTIGGFYCILHLIPRSQQGANVRTDVIAVKASYWAIVVGLMCTAFWLLAAVLIRSLLILKAAQIIH